MASIFDKDSEKKEPTAYDKIGKEIEHLQKKTSTRTAGQTGKTAGIWFGIILALTLLGLFFMDPFLYGIYKPDAIKAYVYLHNYGSGTGQEALGACGVFSRDELLLLNDQHSGYQDYFSSPEDAESTAANMVAFMKGMQSLHEGHYDQLDSLGKLRYTLFVQFGLYPPMVWDYLNPTVK